MRCSAIFYGLMWLLPTMAQQQGRAPLLDSLDYRVEMQASLSAGSHTPLWLNANKYGLSSLEKTNGYLRGVVSRPLSRDDGRRWAVGYGLDVAAAGHYTSKLIVQQAYGELRWLKGVLTVGSKQQPMELKNQELSSGPQTLGVNARPVPQVRLSLPDYWTIPGTKGWLAIKGHIAYGKFTDDKWQKEFTSQQRKYTEGVFYHSKAGYLRIGNRQHTLVSVELGLEMATQFGGTSYLVGTDTVRVYHNQGGVKGALKSLIPTGGGDSAETTYTNQPGNHLGSWQARFNFDDDDWGFSLYLDHFFEDQSGITHLGPDGYGEGDEWDVVKKRRYFLYAFKDMLAGFELRIAENPWLSHLVMEYFYSKYQSSAMYHDHDQTLSDQIAGIDNYYNHWLFTGWQHWGQVMGNPLYTSPLYSSDGKIAVENNRSVAFHMGFCGSPLPGLRYRLLGTWQKGFGTYWQPFPDPRKTVSVMAEATYVFPRQSRWAGWTVKGALGMDRGQLLGNNVGGQLTLTKCGILNLRKR